MTSIQSSKFQQTVAAFSFSLFAFVPHTYAATIASDMVGSSSQNLISFTNAHTSAFASSSDGFQKYQRGVSASIPFSILDDSLNIFTVDDIGIVSENNADEFFGLVDTENPHNTGAVTASWLFDIAGASNLQLSIDVGAMGDFETNDFFVWEYTIDAGPTEVAFASSVDEASSQAYTLEGGATFTLDDPMRLLGATLTNSFASFTVPINGMGSKLLLTLTAMTNGGSEVVAFQNIDISDGAAPPPPVAYKEIHEIQGSGDSSPFDGQQVDTANNVVTTVLGNGFYMQTSDGSADADPQTSQGIFVFTGGAPTVVSGDIVDVSATIDEFANLTELTNVTAVTVTGSGGSVSTTQLTLPLASVDDWESWEGMLVGFSHSLYVSGNFNQGRFGEVDLSVNSPLDNPTNLVDPGSFANLLQGLNDRSKIQLDDGSTAQNPQPLPPYIGAANTLRTGDSVDDLVGILSYGFGRYEIIPTQVINFDRINARPVAVPAVGGSLTLAAFNVLNYFTTIDTGTPICGPNMTLDCRGADTPEEFDLQKSKLVTALSKLDADIVGLVELENASGDVPIDDLVAGVNTANGDNGYSYVETGAIGDDAIRVGIMYKNAKVSLQGSFAVLDSGFDPAFDDARNRPALAQTFLENGTSDTVTVVVNHLKSKGSSCNNIGDFDLGDGQGNCNLTRTAAAEVIAAWLNTDPTSTGEATPAFLIMGDLNAYAQEDPVVALESAGYTDLVEALIGEGWDEGAYSFNFDSQSGYLDHALANPSMVNRTTGAAFWHINADEPRALDYNNFNQAALAATHEFRSSDHDPILIGVCETTPPVVDITLSSTELWPPNHEYATVSANVAVTDADHAPVVSLHTVTSNEPDNGPGDGNTINDIVILDNYSFKLRQERSGSGNGRIYTVAYQVTDACGNLTQATAEVVVPKNRKK